jgi:hypothetical protein
MSYPVFDTGYARNNSDTLRWASVAVASVLVVLCLIWGVMIWTKPKFKADVETSASRTANATAELSSGNMTLRLMIIAFFWLVTLVSTWLSWYVASLHMYKSNLIALDVLNVLIFIMLGLSAYFYYKNPPNGGISSMLVSGSLVLEFVALLTLIISPTQAGANGALTQAALYIPLLVTTVTLMR